MKKIGLGVIWYGGLGQHMTNMQQVEYLHRALHDFSIRVYYFSQQGKQRLLRDAKKGTIDVVLKNAFGRRHEVEVERWLTRHRIPFLGSGVKATFIGTSKLLSKRVFRQHYLPIAQDVTVTPRAWRSHHARLLRQITNKIGFPCVVKDVAGTDSRGLAHAKDMSACRAMLTQLARQGKTAIVEQFISNAYEVNCFVAGGARPRAYVPVGMQGRGGIFSARAKDKMLFRADVPARLPQRIIKRIQHVTLRAHRVLGCQSFSRADILVQGNQLYLLEVDVHPGFHEKSPTTLSVRYAGETLNDLFKKLFLYARTHSIR